MAKSQISKIIDDIDKQLDAAMGKFLINTQSKLSAASPVLTGRLASSWFVGQNFPNRDVPDKRKGSGKNDAWRKGKDKPVIGITPYSGKITFGGTWYISSNLPYTYRAAYDPYNGRRGGGDWFTRIENNLSADADRIFQQYLGKV